MSNQTELRQRGGKSESTSSEPTSLKEISRQNTSKSVGKGPSVILSIITLITISYVSLQVYSFVSGQSPLQIILPPSMGGRFKSDSNHQNIDSNSLSQRFLFNPIRKSLFGNELEKENEDESYKIEVDGKKAEIKIDGGSVEGVGENEPGLGEEMVTQAAKILLDADGSEGDAAENAELRDDI